MQSLSLLWVPPIAATSWMVLLAALDTHRRLKHGVRMIPVAFALGMLSIPLSTALYIGTVLLGLWYLPGANRAFFEQFFIVGPVEETAKFLVFLGVVTIPGAMKEPKDGIILGATVALAFSVIENYGYAVEGGLSTHVYRSIITTPGHMIYGSLWGYAYGRARVRSVSRRQGAAGEYGPVAAAVWGTAMLHGLYNYLLELGHPDLAMTTDLLAALVVAGWLHRLTLSSPFYTYPLRDYRRAIPAIQRGLRIDPRSIVLYRRLGLYLLYAGRFDMAVKAFDRYLATRPKSLYVRIYRGVALFLQGYEDRAGEIIRLAAAKLQAAQRRAVRRHISALVRDRQARDELVTLVQTGGASATGVGAGAGGAELVSDGRRVLLDPRARRRSAAYRTERNRRTPSAMSAGS